MLTKPKLRRAFSANIERPTHKRIRRRSDSSKNISLDILDACASIENKNDAQKQKAGRVRRRRNSLRMGLPTQSIDTNDKDHSTSNGSLPCTRRRSRRATLDECTHELKTAADFVSSNNYERVKLLEIAMTPFEVCYLFASSRGTCQFTNFENHIAEADTNSKNFPVWVHPRQFKKYVRGPNSAEYFVDIYSFFYFILFPQFKLPSSFQPAHTCSLFRIDTRVGPSFRQTWAWSYFWTSSLLQVCAPASKPPLHKNCLNFWKKT